MASPPSTIARRGRMRYRPASAARVWRYCPPSSITSPTASSRGGLADTVRVGTVNCWLLADPTGDARRPGRARARQLGDRRRAPHRRRPADARCRAGRRDACAPRSLRRGRNRGARAGATVDLARAEPPAILGQDDVDRRGALLTTLGAPPRSSGRRDRPRRAAPPRHVSLTADVRTVDDDAILDAVGRRMTAVVSPVTRPATSRCGTQRSGCRGAATTFWAHRPDRRARSRRHRGGAAARAGRIPCHARRDRPTSRAAVVLPGHGKPFTAVDVLVRRLRTHHAARAMQSRRSCATWAATPWDITTCLLWQPDGYRAVLGIAETVTHLDLLEAEGRVERCEDDGRHRYRPST